MDIRPDTHDRSAPSVLLVEDDERFRERLGRALTARGCDVRAVATVDEALAAARLESPELAVVDLKLPVGSGLDVVRGLHAIDPTTRIVVLTGYGSIATALESVKLGATHYLTKPVDADQVLAAFEGRDVTQEPPTVEVPRSRGWSGNTSSASSTTATATSRKRRACWAFTGDRCSASCRSSRPPVERRGVRPLGADVGGPGKLPERAALAPEGGHQPIQLGVRVVERRRDPHRAAVGEASPCDRENPVLV